MDDTRKLIRDIYANGNLLANHLLYPTPFRGHLQYFWRQASMYRSTARGFCDQDYTVFVTGFTDHLATRLDLIGRQTILFEQDVFSGLSSHTGETYGGFCTFLYKNPSVFFDILDTYPELERLLAVVTNNIISFFKEVLTRYAHDKESGRLRLLQPETNRVLLAVVIPSGETHEGSRTVVFLKFAGNLSIVYKPRDLALEEALHNFLFFVFAENLECFDWFLPKYVAEEMYGWMQWVDNLQVASKSEASTFFYRAGLMLSFFEFLGISDMHNGNIVARGASPVPIDMETAFSHCQSAVFRDKKISFAQTWNVLATGFLPQWAWKGADLVGVDLCGLGGLEKQYCSLPLYQNRHRDTENESFEDIGVDLYPEKNILKINGVTAYPWDYLHEFRTGFDDGITAFKRKKIAVLKWVEHATAYRTRYIARATAGYHYAITCSLNPRLMQSYEARRRYLTQCLDENKILDIQAREVEVSACMDCDVPRFTTTAKDLSVTDEVYGQGTANPDSLVPGRETALEILENYDESRHRFDQKLIFGSIHSIRHYYTNRELSSLEASLPDLSLNTELPAPTVTLLANASMATMDHTKLFLGNEFDAAAEAWYGFKASANGGIEYGEIGVDFYYGASGIVYGCELIGTPVDLDTLLRLENSIFYKLTDGDDRLGGAYIGAASALLPAVYSFESRSMLGVRDSILEAGKLAFHRAVKNGSISSNFFGLDLMGGISGALQIAALLYSVTGDTDWAFLANQLFYSLVENAVSFNGLQLFPQSISISTHPSRCLTGMSHGQIGIAIAVSDFASCVAAGNDKKVADELIRGLVNWEIAQYSGTTFNWPDYRVRSTKGSKGEFGWSHGAPGIYLGLQKLAQRNVAEAAAFVSSVSYGSILQYAIANAPKPINETLCHGALSVLLLARRILGAAAAEYEEKLLKWSRVSAFATLDSSPVRLRDVDMPGLWQGKTGAALGYRELTSSPGGSSLHAFTLSDLASLILESREEVAQ